MTSPYLDRPLRTLAEVRGEPPFLLGPDEVCVSVAEPRRRWRKKVVIWAVALAILVLGVAIGPHAAMYFQMLAGE